MDSAANIVVYAGLLIGLLYGAVGLLSGFCLMSGLRGWWAEGDSRLIRSYAMALGVAIAATQLLAAGGVVDLGQSIYLQPSFSVPLMFCRHRRPRQRSFRCRNCCRPQASARHSRARWWPR
jgi:hypothetical protein